MRSSKKFPSALLLLMVLVALIYQGWTGNSGVADALVDDSWPPSPGQIIQIEGSVERILSDDNSGSRHQRFIMALEGGRTLLIAHNIDLAPRAPVAEGGAVAVRGEYEPNDLGGVLHWTHHDPDGDHPGGWIEVDGKLYR